MGRVVLVTGGGGAGMGSAICRRFAEGGDTVVVTDHDAASAELVAKELVAEGFSAFAAKLDLRDRASCEPLVRRVVEEHGRLDVLCLHAGGGGMGIPRARPDALTGAAATGQSLRLITDEALDAVVQIDILGNTALARPALQHMVDRGGGTIAVTISEAGLRALGPYPYTLVKHAMVGFVRHVAFVFAAAGIRCNAICPGFLIDPTRDAQQGLAGATVDEVRRNVQETMSKMGIDPFLLDATLKTTQLSPRAGSPREIAEVYHFIASEAASYLNGAIIPVDAGWSAG
jgi:NAD(P)-dependent dehydrogenase (short-subunit alcohol dehydrogenase family)